MNSAHVLQRPTALATARKRIGNAYADADKRRDGASREETAHRVAWAAVKQSYEKKDDRWVKKD